jgi:hypothetical protein
MKSLQIWVGLILNKTYQHFQSELSLIDLDVHTTLLYQLSARHKHDSYLVHKPGNMHTVNISLSLPLK